jgi:transcriptional regulator with XRE-family HTH domain
MSIGERITELRKLQNLTQGQLADALHVSRQAVSKWENGQSNPDSQNLIQLTEVLDTDIEYLTTGRKTYGRRPPVVIKTVETVEKVVEVPVVQVVETVVEKTVEKPTVQYIEKPVIKKVFRVKYRRNPVELAIVGGIGFLIGLLVGFLI